MTDLFSPSEFVAFVDLYFLLVFQNEQPSLNMRAVSMIYRGLFSFPHPACCFRNQNKIMNQKLWQIKLSQTIIICRLCLEEMNILKLNRGGGKRQNRNWETRKCHNFFFFKASNFERGPRVSLKRGWKSDKENKTQLTFQRDCVSPTCLFQPLFLLFLKQTVRKQR